MADDIQGRVFSPVGRCIYCESTENLSSEHIMPFSLGGNAELPAASCEACAAITSYIDGYLGRSIYYEYRLSAGIQSRTPGKSRPTTIVSTFMRNGTPERYNLKIGEHAFYTVLPVLGPPGILTGRGRLAPFPIFKAHMYYYVPDQIGDTLNLEDGENIQMMASGSINLTAFARGMAKIAYCHAVAQGHVKPSSTLPIARLIRGEIDSEAPYFVGSETWDDPGVPDGPSVLHRVKFTWDIHHESRILAAHIRLFANAGTAEHGMPTYYVAVTSGPL